MATTWPMLAACCVALAALAGSAPRAAAEDVVDVAVDLNRTAVDFNRTAVQRLGEDQSVVFGPIDTEGLHLLFRIPIAEAGVLQIEIRVDFLYPPEDTAFPDGYNVGSVQVLDQLRDGSNGVVQLTRGGVGENVVGLQFLSQPGQSISYIVEVWGTPE